LVATSYSHTRQLDRFPDLKNFTLKEEKQCP